MTRKNRQRNTVIIILCFLLIFSVINISQSKIFTPPPWLASLWNWITDAKDTLEGIQLLIDALTTELEEAEDDLTKTKFRKEMWLKRRNKVKKLIQPDEQRENAAIRAKDKATKAHDKAIKDREELLKESEELVLTLKHALYPVSDKDLQSLETLEKEAKKAYDSYVKMCGDSYYCTETCPYCNQQSHLYHTWQRYNEQVKIKKAEQRLAEITTKISELEETIKTEKANYNKARQDIREIRDKLDGPGGTGPGHRWDLRKYSQKINICENEITALIAKIEKLKKRIVAEGQRRANLDGNIEKEETKYEKLKKEAKEDPDPK